MAQQSFIAYDSKTGESYGIEARCSSVADIAGNSSKVTVEVILHHGAINIKKRTAGTISIDGNKINYSTPAINAASTDTPVASHTVTVQHDADGTKSVEISASFPYELYSTKYKVNVDVVTVRGTFVLDRIGRVSVIADQTREIVANGADDNLWFLKMTRSSDTFWHKATLTIGTGNDPWIYTTDPFETEVTGTTSTDWLYKMTTEKVGTMNVSVRTYLDEDCSEAIGDPVETTFAVKLPDDAYPTFSPDWATAAIYNDGTAAKDVKAAIQGYSRLQIDFDGGYVTTKYGASLVGFRAECEGKVYSCNVGTDSKAQIITDTLNNSGTTPLLLYPVDSRGACTLMGMNTDVYAYFEPRIIKVSVFRCDSTGVAADNGRSISVKAGVEYAKCGDANSVELKADIRAAGDTTGETHMLEADQATVCGNDGFDERKSYVVDLTATDLLGNSATYRTRVSTDDISFHIRNGGKGGAFGKYAEHDGLLDVAWKLKVEGTPVVGAKIVASGGNISVATSSGSKATLDVYSDQNQNFEPGLYIVAAFARWNIGGGSARSFTITKSTPTDENTAYADATYANTMSPPVSELMTVQNVFAIVPVEDGEKVSVGMLQNSGTNLNVTLNYTVARIGALISDTTGG